MADYLLNSPTPKLLLIELKSVTEWRRFGIFLELKDYDLDKIASENRDVENCKREMFSLWLRVETSPSWELIVRALEELSHHKLAAHIRQQYLHQQTTPPKAVSQEPANGSKSRASLEIKLTTSDKMAELFDDIEIEFTKLVTDLQQILEQIIKNKQLQLDPLRLFCKRTLKLYCLNSVTSVDDLFDKLDPYYSCLGYTILKRIIKSFLNHTSLVQQSQAYDEHLEQFKKSTTLQQFKEDVEHCLEPPHGGEETCTVTIRLVGDWLEMTIANLELLMKEIFQDKSEILTHLRIKKGSVIVTYLTPQSESDILLGMIKEKLSFLSQVGVCGVQVGEEEVIMGDHSNMVSFSFEAALIKAMKINDLSVVNFLLQMNTSPDTIDEHGWPVIVIAASKGHHEIVNLLLNTNANPNITAINDLTALYIASLEGHREIVNFLLKAKANPNIPAVNDLTALSIASMKGHSEIVNLLLKADADPNIQAINGVTALYIASKKGHHEIVDLLLKANANPNLQRNSDVTALYMASQEGHHELADLLIKVNSNPNLPVVSGATALYIASEKGHHEIVNLLLKAGALPNLPRDDGVTALYTASQNGHHEVVGILLIANANPNLPRDDGVTALYMASQEGHCKVVDLLLQANANPNLPRDDGVTALFMASQNGHNKVVDFLLKANANPNLPRGDGATALLMASQNGHHEIVNFLLKAGADPNLMTRDGHTPLMAACSEGNETISDLLLSSGADPSIKSKTRETALSIAMSVGHDQCVELLKRHGVTPLTSPNSLLSGSSRLPTVSLLTVMKKALQSPFTTYRNKPNTTERKKLVISEPNEPTKNRLRSFRKSLRAILPRSS